MPIWLGGRFLNAAPLRRATSYDGYFVIGLDQPTDVGTVAAQVPSSGFDLVIDLRTDQDHAPWLDSGASWVLTRIGLYDLDLADVERLADLGPNPR